MTSHYEILRPVTPADLNAHPSIVEVLKEIPSQGHLTSEPFRHIERSRASRGITYACSVGILKRVSPHAQVLKMDSVKFWCTQFNESGHKNTTPGHSTREMYLGVITKLNGWLSGRSFPSYKTVVSDGQVIRQSITKSFETVEALMHYCIESDHGTKTAQRVMREYMANPHVSEASASMQTATRSAIKSYFNAHDIVLDLPVPRKKRADQTPGDDSPMTLEDFYKVLQNGKPSIIMRTIMLIKLQSGMDSSTLADRFNHEGYPQLVKYFKTENHESWNLVMCPVPIRLVRVKTGVQYTTFLDHDAIVQLQEYLTWKEAKYGRQDISKPLFMTKHNTPIHSAWLSTHFSKMAINAGIQKKISRRVYRIRAHEVRDLLKSTLITCGCAQYAADHVLGHAPRDSYEKQATLYPEDLRAEYAKASSRINIFSKIENNLNGQNDPESQNVRIRELESQVKALTRTNSEDGILEGKHKDIITKLNNEVRHLLDMFDSLPDDIKAKMAGRLKDLDDQN